MSSPTNLVSLVDQTTIQQDAPGTGNTGANTDGPTQQPMTRSDAEPQPATRSPTQLQRADSSSATALSQSQQEIPTGMRSRTRNTPRVSRIHTGDQGVLPHRAHTLDVSVDPQVWAIPSTRASSAARFETAVRRNPQTLGFIRHWVLFYYEMAFVYAPCFGTLNAMNSIPSPLLIFLICYLLFLIRVIIRFGQQYWLVRCNGPNSKA